MNRVFLAVLAVVVLTFIGCRRESKYASLRDNPVPAEVEVVTEGAGVVTNVYVGEILAKADIPLVFPLGGQLTSLQVKSGQKVREGQVIATVDNTQAKSMLESAEAMLNQAEDAWRRLKPLHENGGLSDVKWVEMETNLSKARSMVISSRKRYEDCTLRASQAGVVNLFDVEVGQHLNVGQPIGSLLDMTGKKASFTVPENEIGHLLHGDKLTVSLPALDLSFSATLDEKSLVATRLAHTYKVTVILDPKANTDILLPGMVCRIVTNSKNVEGYIVSSGCVQTQQSGHTVWVVRNGRAERVPIRIGAFVENGVLVTEGLQAGDTVVSKGYQKMYKGARIQ